MGAGVLGAAAGSFGGGMVTSGAGGGGVKGFSAGGATGWEVAAGGGGASVGWVVMRPEYWTAA